MMDLSVRGARHERNDWQSALDGDHRPPRSVLAWLVNMGLGAGSWIEPMVRVPPTTISPRFFYFIFPYPNSLTTLWFPPPSSGFRNGRWRTGT